MSRRTSNSWWGRFGLNPFVCLGFVGLILVLGAALPSLASSATLTSIKAAASELPSELEKAGWRPLKVLGRSKAEFSHRSSDRIGISADRAVGFLYRAVDDEMGPKRRLAWSWRVDQAVAPTDLSQAPGDDRSLAVHLVFPADEERLSFWERVEIALTRLVAPPMAGKVLTYVWGGTQAQGAVLANPYLNGQGQIIVLRSGDGPIGQWFMEEIDFVADFQRAFGYNPPTPAFIAISADSDDTGGRILGTVADLAFEG